MHPDWLWSRGPIRPSSPYSDQIMWNCWEIRSVDLKDATWLSNYHIASFRKPPDGVSQTRPPLCPHVQTRQSSLLFYSLVLTEINLLSCFCSKKRRSLMQRVMSRFLVEHFCFRPSTCRFLQGEGLVSHWPVCSACWEFLVSALLWLAGFARGVKAADPVCLLAGWYRGFSTRKPHVKVREKPRLQLGDSSHLSDKSVFPKSLRLLV